MVVTYYSKVWINRVRLPIPLVLSWTGKIIITLSPWEPESLVSRDGFVAECSKCPDQSKHNLHTMLVVFSAEPDAQDSAMNSQDTDRL